jgi:heme-degrading monooxygenase HmoA
MFTRVVEIRTKAGKAEELCHKIHNRILTILKAQPGFVDEIVLVSATEADRVVALSFWKTQEDAERYSVDQYAQIRDLIENQVHTAPKVHTFKVETSTTHKIARGRAA